MNPSEIEQLRHEFLHTPQNPMPNAVAKEIEQLREQQETIWWTDKQYEWMKKNQGEDLDVSFLHLMHGQMIERDKQKNYSVKEKDDPIGIIFFFLIVIAFITFCLAS